MLTIADGGVQEPLILADVICEQPLRYFFLAGIGLCYVVVTRFCRDMTFVAT